MAKEKLTGASTNKLEKWLMRNDEDKIEIETLIKGREEKAEADWKLCKPEEEIYIGYYTPILMCTDQNIFWRLAKEKLYKENHPTFYTAGRGTGRIVKVEHDQNNLVDKEVVWTIIQKMYDIAKKFDAIWGRWNKTPQQVIETLYEGSEDEKLIRRLSK